MTGASATTITPMTTVAIWPTRAICLSDLFFQNRFIEIECQ